MKMKMATSKTTSTATISTKFSSQRYEAIIINSAKFTKHKHKYKHKWQAHAQINKRNKSPARLDATHTHKHVRTHAHTRQSYRLISCSVQVHRSLCLQPRRKGRTQESFHSSRQTQKTRRHTSNSFHF